MNFSVDCPTCAETIQCEEDLSDACHGEVLRSLVEECPKCKEPFVTEIRVEFHIAVRAVKPPSRATP